MLKIGMSLFLKKLKQFNKRHSNSGAYAEQLAASYLKKHRLIIIDRNFFCKLGEIDLICLEKETIIFIEVRFRRKNKFGSAADSITKSKQKKIINTAQYWIMQKNMHHHKVRFDAVLFDGKTTHKHLTWLKAVF